MSIETTVSVGTYLVCTMTIGTTSKQEVVQCTRNKDHDVEHHHKFCPHCGAHVLRVEKTVAGEYVSLAAIDTGDVRVPEQDLDWVFSNFGVVYSEPTNEMSASQELITYRPGTHFVSADEESTTEIDTMSFVRPSDADIDRLKSIVGYSEVEVKFGMIVSIS